MSRAVSIQDIARAAGVSHATVSRALHESPLISAAMRARVRTLAEEMGYTPNAVAQSLKGRSTQTVGLVVTSIADPFLARVVRGIEEAAQAAHFSVLLSSSHNDPECEMAVIETFQRRRVDGVIVAAAQISSQYAQRLARVNVPVVLLNQQAEEPNAKLRSVSADDYGGASQAVQHLLGLGHRRIGYLGAGNRPRSNRLRLQAYRDALAAAGLPTDPALVRIAAAEHRLHSDDVTGGSQLLPPLLAAGASAVFCYNDMTAIGALMACRARDIAVPAQLSIVGYDDIEMAQFVTPPLTTVHQPKLRLGQVAMEMLLGLLAGQAVADSTLATELIVRESSAGAKRQPGPQSSQR